MAVWRTPGVRAKFRLVFGCPDRAGPALRNDLERQFLSRSTGWATTRRFRSYVVGQMAGVLLILFGLILFERQVSGFGQGLVAVFMLLTLINCGALPEQRRWVVHLELARLVILWVILYAATGVQLLIILAYIGGLCWWAYQSLIQRYYFTFLYGTIKQPTA